MKKAIWAMPAVLLAFAVAQTQPSSQPASGAAQQGQSAQPPSEAVPPPQAQVYGRGRGGLPWAWNDRDKDGICDVTGRPVGQRPLGWGRGAGAWGGGGWGRGAGAWGGGWGRGAGAWGGGWGRGRGFAARGGGWGRWWGPGYPMQTAPAQPPASTAPAQPKQ